MPVEFFLDHMLGKLTRWVRFMGYHAGYASPGMTDGDIAEFCKSGTPVLLSRDRELCARVQKSLFIRSPQIESQLRQFVAEYEPVKDNMMRICPVCDGNLVHAEKESLRDEIPGKVFDNATEFWRCENCGKIYWNGTHYDKIIRKISELTGAGHES